MAELNVKKTHTEEVQQAYERLRALGVPKDLARRRAVREVEIQLIDEEYRRRELGWPANDWYF
jgi:hypothetical protein